MNKLINQGFLPKRAGFSIIELMIAMGLGLLILASIFSLYINVSDSNGKLNVVGQQIENGRFAIHLLKSELAHAGFYGLYSPNAAGATIPASPPDPCDKDFFSDLGASVWFPVMGYSSIPPSCSLTDYQPGTEVLIVRHAATCISDSNSVDACANTSNAKNCPCSQHIITGDPLDIDGYVYLKSDPASFEFFCLGDASPCSTVSKSGDIRRFIMNIYYIRNWFGDENEAPKIPALVRKSLGRELGKPKIGNAEALIGGIENLQLEYGLDITGNDGFPDQYITLKNTDWSQVDWSQVVTVRLKIFSKAADSNPTLEFPSREFSEVVRLINVAGRRETP